MLEIIETFSAEVGEKINNQIIKSLKEHVFVPFAEVNMLLDTDWTLETYKLVASFFNTRNAEGDFVYTGNLDTERELDYFEMVKRILHVTVIDHPEAPAFPQSVLMRILSSSQNKCFLGCVMSFVPEDFCNTLNCGEVFLPEVFQNIIATAERRYAAI